MSLLNTIKEKLYISKLKQTIDNPIYMRENARFVCSDTKNNVTVEMSIVPEHASNDTEEPNFGVTRYSFREGQLSAHYKKVLNLNTDDAPIQGSKNLLTSGTLYHIINDLQTQITELQEKINK